MRLHGVSQLYFVVILPKNKRNIKSALTSYHQAAGGVDFHSNLYQGSRPQYPQLISNCFRLSPLNNVRGWRH
jgi:hypothetical protein